MEKSKFFRELQSHSNAKIEILHRYYVPWLRKITMGHFNKNRCLVIDGFAGEGIYEDGSIGSPIVLIDEALKFCNQNLKENRQPPDISIILIEGTPKIYKKLIENISSRYALIEEKNYLTIDGYESIKIVIFNSSFEEVMERITSKGSLRPSFCFVDPFGFSHTPFHIFEKFLANSKSEILFNFMYEEINRFITYTDDHKIAKKYEDLFGSANLDGLRSEVKGLNAPLRKEKIINYYAKQLLEKTDSKYVLNFEFKKNGRTKMFLVHATKNIHGLALMKEVMWLVDETGAFLYDDSKDEDQISFEYFDAYTKEEHQKKLSEIIFEKFEHQKSVKLETIECFILEETIYPLTNYYKPAMKLLETAKLINVLRKPHARKGSFNEKTLLVQF